MKKIVLEKEDMQTNVSLPPSVDQVMKHSKQQKKFLSNYATVGSSNPTKVKEFKEATSAKKLLHLKLDRS
ncbi:hypothetical protein H5410_056396 [Solanum commersonii]|uniref:Uncharacterized protein n=1 Tax=Solanum commersonii TaxID=4109 RepID=A0A9J5WMZ1_SOLCO|nr:hypothetical protein H5410_056396 [Solanum commersonii]